MRIMSDRCGPGQKVEWDMAFKCDFRPWLADPVRLVCPVSLSLLVQENGNRCKRMQIRWWLTLRTCVRSRYAEQIWSAAADPRGGLGQFFRLIPFVRIELDPCSGSPGINAWVECSTDWTLQRGLTIGSDLSPMQDSEAQEWTNIQTNNQPQIRPVRQTAHTPWPPFGHGVRRLLTSAESVKEMNDKTSQPCLGCLR